MRPHQMPAGGRDDQEERRERMERLLAAVLAAVTGAGLLQVVPVRVDIWTWLGKRLTRALNGEVLDKLGELERRMEKMERQGERE